MSIPKLTSDNQHFFPRLPPEIRIKIWNLSLPGPRIVEVRCGSDTISNKCPNGPGLISLVSLFGDGTEGGAGCRSSAPLPVTLHVNRESRAETLRAGYRPMFGVAGRPGRVYFHPTQDVLYFGRKGTGLMGPHAQYRTVFALCEGDLACVRRIAVDEAVLGSPAVVRGSLGEVERSLALDRAVYEFFSHMSKLEALEELVFVSKDGRCPFDPQLPVDVTEEYDPETAPGCRALRVAISLALQRVAEYEPRWRRPPAWSMVSRSSFV
jgi:hypothetical protein